MAKTKKIHTSGYDLAWWDDQGVEHVVACSWVKGPKEGEIEVSIPLGVPQWVIDKMNKAVMVGESDADGECYRLRPEPTITCRVILNTFVRADDMTCILAWTDADGIEHEDTCPVSVASDGKPHVDLTCDAVPDALSKELAARNVNLEIVMLENEVPTSGDYYCFAPEH
jgi:hypothetical protein